MRKIAKVIRAIPDVLARTEVGQRPALFDDVMDISDQVVRHDLAKRATVDPSVVAWFIESGRAHAELMTICKDADASDAQGNPSIIRKDGRQKLFGNVGYRIIEANIEELLRRPSPDQAS